MPTQQPLLANDNNHDDDEEVKSDTTSKKVVLPLSASNKVVPQLDGAERKASIQTIRLSQHELRHLPSVSPKQPLLPGNQFVLPKTEASSSSVLGTNLAPTTPPNRIALPPMKHPFRVATASGSLSQNEGNDDDDNNNES